MDKCSICPSNGRISTPVSYVVFEAGMARLERTNKRVIVALILTILMLFASNIAWLYVWSQYDYDSEIVTEYQQDGTGINIIGDRNGVYHEPEIQADEAQD